MARMTCHESNFQLANGSSATNLSTSGFCLMKTIQFLFLYFSFDFGDFVSQDILRH